MKKILLVFIALLLLCGCENVKEDVVNEHEIAKVGSLELQYATQYSVDYYEKGYIHVHVEDGTDYVLVPENENENNLGLTNQVYIHMPCDKIYLAASSAMDLFLELGELDSITTCSTLAKDYAMQDVKNAIENDAIAYVGKYSAPDYEMLLSRGCNLAIESTMISHSPKIKEQIERINIPVFVERSSYESNPLGRLEWIKLYGILTGKEKEAEEYFNKELEKIEQIAESVGDENKSRKTVAFFSITSNGYVTVRKPGDYICKMIDMAGGEYALNQILIEEENALSTINIGMEDFYREACNADILIYNGSIDGGVGSLEDLLNKNELLGQFKAVKEGAVWSTSLNMFQESSKIAQVIKEMSNLISETGNEYIYLKHLQ